MQDCQTARRQLPTSAATAAAMFFHVNLPCVCDVIAQSRDVITQNEGPSSTSSVEAVMLTRF